MFDTKKIIHLTLTYIYIYIYVCVCVYFDNIVMGLFSYLLKYIIMLIRNRGLQEARSQAHFLIGRVVDLILSPARLVGFPTCS